MEGAAGNPGFDLIDPSQSGIRFTNALPIAAVLQNQNLLNGSGVAAGDVDGDGRPDLYFCAIRGTNALYLNRGQWGFEDVTDRYGVGCAGAQSTGAVLVDTEGDGDLDLLVTSLGHGLRLFRNEGGRQFLEVTREAGVASTTGSTSLAVGDVDGDGDLDVYVANYGAL
ncbi:MAG: VCBS repeat-containing protein, partial [Verrucomicrobiales bacterium]|nr:VCBS repeat-containing protein [Verrucomicrobiales bacterium]